jgi:hypothetical protein
MLGEENQVCEGLQLTTIEICRGLFKRWQPEKRPEFRQTHPRKIKFGRSFATVRALRLDFLV